MHQQDKSGLLKIMNNAPDIEIKAVLPNNLILIIPGQKLITEPVMYAEIKLKQPMLA